MDKETNLCVDVLANIGCEHATRLRVYVQCLTKLSSLMLADLMGITTPRVSSFLFFRGCILVYFVLVNERELKFYL